MNRKNRKSHSYFLKAQNCHNLEKSIDFLDQALLLDKSNTCAYILRAINLAKQSRFSEATYDLEEAHNLAADSLRVSFADMLVQFYKGKHDEVLDAATTIIGKALDDPLLITPNLSDFKGIFQENDYLQLTTDDLAICYLYRAKSLFEMNDYNKSFEDIRKASELETTPKIREMVSSMKRRLIKSVEIQAKKGQELKLTYRILNSLFSMPEVCFWILSLILFGYSVKCFSDARPTAAFNLLALSTFIFPPLITTVSWVISKVFSFNIIKLEKMMFVFFLVIFSIFTWGIISENFSNSNFADSADDSVSSPRLQIAIGMDSDVVVEKMFDFAQENGGDVNCERNTPMICEYLSPSGDRTLVYFEHEFTHYAMTPRITKVIGVEYR